MVFSKVECGEFEVQVSLLTGVAEATARGDPELTRQLRLCWNYHVDRLILFPLPCAIKLSKHINRTHDHLDYLTDLPVS